MEQSNINQALNKTTIKEKKLFIKFMINIKLKKLSKR